MAFYRPTKINSLFFTSNSGKRVESSARSHFHHSDSENTNDLDYSTSDTNKNYVSARVSSNRTHYHINTRKSDKSDHLTVRSVDEQFTPGQATEAVYEANNHNNRAEDSEVGGISNIPGFSSSEEKLLEYQPSTSTADGLLYENENNEFLDNVASEVTDKYESITADIGKQLYQVQSILQKNG